MIPFLTYPLALLALASLPALTAIYIFRNRFRRKQVSSLMLWRFRLQTKQGGRKVHKLQLPLVFFLELLALLLLVVAATGPQWNLPQSNRPLVVILDDSFSMRAVNDGTSMRDRAKAFLEKIFRQEQPPSARFILAGKEPRLMGAPVKTWAEASELLEQWKCWSPAASIEQAINMASEIGKNQANVLVLSDRAPEGEITGGRMQWRAFGSPLRNMAIVNASRTVHGDQDRCLLEVANLSDASRTSRMIVQTGTNAVSASQVALGPRERQRFVFNISATAPRLQVTLDADSVPEDNEALLLPPVRKRVRVQVSLTNATVAELVERTLESTGLRASISQNPELVIHQSAGAPAGSNAWSLRWLQSQNAAAYTGPFVIDGAHPLAQGIGLHGVIWAATPMTNATSETPVILAGNVPLLSEREDATGRRHLTFNLSPELSTLHNTPDWPILIWNVLQWRTSQMPGLLENNTRLGADVVLRTTGEPVTLRHPDGATKSYLNTGGELALETPLPGLYSVEMGQMTNSFAVNLLAGDESDLSKCASGTWGKWSEDTERRFEETSVLWAFALGALAIMTTHMFLVAKGRGSQ
jgi:hypothetical protein